MMQVIAHQKFEPLAVFPVQAQAPGDGGDHVRALVAVVLALPLADIVEEDGQKQKLPLLDIVGDLGQKRLSSPGNPRARA